MSKHPFRGMGVALVTPFTESQEVDYKSLERLLEHLLRDGATDFIRYPWDDGRVALPHASGAPASH